MRTILKIVTFGKICRGVADGGEVGGGGVLTPALLKTRDFDPPPPDSRIKWPKSGVFSDF